MADAKLWQIDPHTTAKHLLLKGYLDGWFPILGRSFNRLNYIDGFAGPGEYAESEKGSPVLAVESALAHLDNGTLSPRVKIHFLFVERDGTYAAHLKEILRGLNLPPQFDVEVFEGEFRDRIDDLLSEYAANNQRLPPTFAFIDPFGFSGVPMDLVARILQAPHSEVFVNVMVDFINRFLEHPSDAVTSHFPATFGTDAVLEIPTQSGNRIENLLSLYRLQLHRHARFVGRFDMYGKRNQQTYSLFFASNSPKGFQKIKEAMWGVDKSSGKRFSDAFARHGDLFEGMSIEPLWDDLMKQFSGRLVPMREIEKFVNEETDYLPKHARRVLKEEEKAGRIDVEVRSGQKRRAGTFPPGKVQIRFPG